MNDRRWRILAIALVLTGCAGHASDLADEDSACRETAEQWEKAPEGRAHALIEQYYEVDSSATKEEIFRLCKEHERKALEHPELY